MKKLLLLLLLSNAAASVVAANLSVSELEKGVFLYRSEKAVEGYGMVTGNGLIVETGEQMAVLIDTPWEDEDVDSLFDWLKAHSLTLQAVIVTHSHDDAGGHLERFHAKHIPTWTYELTNQLLTEQGKTPALHTFSNSQWITPHKLEAFYPGPGHTLDNSVVWVADREILFGGCFIREMATSSMGYTAEGDIAQWSGSVDKVIARYPQTQMVIPGHGEPGAMALLTHTQALAITANAR